MSDLPHTNLIEWPPHYTLKRHARAKYVKFKASHREGLEIVVPTRFNLKELPKIIEENRTWIEKRLREIQSLSRASLTHVLPEQIHLKAIQQLWKIIYIKSHHKKLKLMIRPTQEIVLVGNIDDHKKCFELLISWIRLQAERHLKDCIQQLSERMQLSFKKVMIRNQKSRWGSCTSDKVISLNYRLLFLPQELMTHILIHELCHTVQLNHSARFWRLVAKFDPDWKQHSKEVKHAEKWMPDWIHHT